uniref:Uncharacterized protein n=1 Tax=Helianthus annuus TaxID=4232 RepID=A0A251SCU5_HELAN
MILQYRINFILNCFLPLRSFRGGNRLTVGNRLAVGIGLTLNHIAHEVWTKRFFNPLSFTSSKLTLLDLRSFMSFI